MPTNNPDGGVEYRVVMQDSHSQTRFTLYDGISRIIHYRVTSSHSDFALECHDCRCL